MSFVNACCAQVDLGDGRFRSIHSLKPMAYSRKGVLLPNVLAYDGTLTLDTAPLRAKADADGGMVFRPLPEDDETWIAFGAPQMKIGTDFAKAVMSAPTLSRAAQSVVCASVDYETEWLHAGHYCSWLMRPHSGYVIPGGTILFPVTMNGLELKGDTFLSEGKPVCILRPPGLHDLADPDAEMRPVKYEWTVVEKRMALVLSDIDTKGMLQPEIDPTLALQPDAAAGKDTHIRAALPVNNYGIALLPVVGGEGGGTAARMMIGFDVSSIPTTAAVNSGLMGLYCVSEASTTDRDIGAHRGLTAWWEGDRDDFPLLGGHDGSTWNERNHNGSLTWGAAGGLANTDYATAATDTKTITVPAAWYTWDITPDVKAWVAGTANNGSWMINTAETTIDSRKRFLPSDYTTDTSLRPKLTVDYTLAGGRTLFGPFIGAPFG